LSRPGVRISEDRKKSPPIGRIKWDYIDAK
jgi:hypothetical protein